MTISCSISPRSGSLLLCLLYLFTLAFISPLDAADNTELDISLTEDTILGSKIRVYLIPKDKATISSEIDGKILSLPFVMGESFNQGDLLVEIDSELAQAAQDKALKVLEASQINLEAIQDLRSRNDATLVELIDAERDLAAAQAGLTLAQKNLAMCRIHAPYSGRVIKVEKNAYELAKTGEPLISIIDDNTLLAHFLLPITEFPHTKIGSEVEVTIPLLKQSFKAKISQISATLDAASGTFEVAGDIDNSEKLLRAGMSGWITLKQRAAESNGVEP